VLPALCGRLPLLVPAPVYAGQASARYPWPFQGYRLLPGRTVCRAALDEAARAALGPPLATFLRALHALPAGELELPGDAIGKLDVERRRPAALLRLGSLVASGLLEEADRPPRERILLDSPGGPPPFEAVLVHGDLYARHLLIDEAGWPSGVIDWGDVHLGPRAVDLAIAWQVLPAPAREALGEALAVDQTTWGLARFRALDHASSAATYANAVGDADLIREATLALHRLTS
jgi:aminoglycoside phosphotransferase (APT) family kinase protein